MSELPLEIFEKYKAELELDTKIDELNMKEVQMKLPAIKHKWVARLIQAKADLRKLSSAKFKAVEQMKYNINAPIELSDASKTAAVNKQEIIQRIDKQISQQELIIDYLTRVEQITKNMTYDLKNLIDIVKLESM